MAVAVDVAHGDSVATPTGEPADPRARGDVLEGAVSLVVKQAVPTVARWRAGVGDGGERAALDAVDVEPTVAVVVEKGEPAAEGLGKLVERGLGIVVDEPEPHGLGVVCERELAAGPGTLPRDRGQGARRCVGPEVGLR